MSRNYFGSKVELYKKLADNTWDSTAITLTDAKDVKCTKGLGKKKDTFEFRVANDRNKYFRTYYDGDGSTTAFTLTWTPPSTYLSEVPVTKVRVFVDEVELTYTTDYTISGSTITFDSAPSSDIKNIEVRFEVISADDKIRIYLWKNSLTSSTSDLIMEGTIIEPDTQVSDGARSLAFRGVSFIDTMFNTLTFADTELNKKPHTIIQAVIAQINNYNLNRVIYGESSTEWSALNNATTRSDGTTAFEDVNYYTTYKKAIEVIEELSSDRYTGSGQYIYWVTFTIANGYEFHWTYKTGTVAATLVEGTDDIKDFKFNKSVEEVINAVIFNTGIDCYDNGHEELYFDPASQSAVGSRWYYMTTTAKIAEGLINAEFIADTSLWNTTSDGARTENFPKDAEVSSWTFQFEAVDETEPWQFTLTGSNATATSDETFNDAIVNQAYYLGTIEAARVVKLFGNPRYKGTVNMVLNTTDYVIGDLLDCTFPSFGLYNKKLRVQQIDYFLDRITIHLEEDESTIE